MNKVACQEYYVCEVQCAITSPFSLVANILARERGYLCLGIATCCYADLVGVDLASTLFGSMREVDKRTSEVAALAITADLDGESTIALSLPDMDCMCKLRYLSSWALDTAAALIPCQSQYRHVDCGECVALRVSR